MKIALSTLAIAASTFAFALSFSPTWTEQDGLSLSTSTAEAGARVYIRTGYASSANYYTGSGPWYAVRAYYFGGPWSGNGYSYTDWADYAARNGIGCVPGTAIKGGDNIMYNCQ